MRSPDGRAAVGGVIVEVGVVADSPRGDIAVVLDAANAVVPVMSVEGTGETIPGDGVIDAV